jgi:hypothetical protein
MEIKEILSYYLNTDSNILEVSFRTIEDNDDVLRIDQIDYTLVTEYGYLLETDSFDFFGADSDEDEIDKEEVELDEDMLITFLNEYYTINSNAIPKSEIY